MTPHTKETSLRLNLIRILTSSKSGLTFEEISKALGIRSTRQLKKILGQLYMIGTHPYTPNEYLEVDLDGDRVKLAFPLNPRKTIALRSTEWLILRNSLISSLKSLTDPKRRQRIEGILKKIQTIIPFASIQDYENLKDLIREAIRTLRILQFHYLNRMVPIETKEQEEYTLRIVEPWYLWEERQVHSRSYLIGYCRTRKAPRVFRLDQITNIAATDEMFQNPDKQKIEKALESFRNFLYASEKSSEKAILWHTRKSHYYLNQILNLTTTGESKVIQGIEFIRSECLVREKNWFLDTISGFLPDVFLESPSHLTEEIRKRISFCLEQL